MAARHRIGVQIAPPFRSAVRAPWLRAIARRVLAAESAGPAALGIAITDDVTVRDLNRRYLGLDEPTDVLSFGLSEESDTPFALPPGEAAPLGEVIISYPTAVQQAEEEGHSVEAELAHLLVHGILHLLGYDHLEREGERAMRRREEEVLAGYEQLS
ncbi:MAG: rRNA maturation RNase YbeY [Chloroflexota bacterium]|nr:rRNA maturation RNase YbeY [Chloroflexota bacterium]